MELITPATHSVAELVNYRDNWVNSDASMDGWFKSVGAYSMSQLKPREQPIIGGLLNDFWHVHTGVGGRHALQYRIDTKPIYDACNVIQKMRRETSIYDTKPGFSKLIDNGRSVFEIPISLLTYLYLKTGINMITAGPDQIKEMYKWSQNIRPGADNDAESKLLVQACTVNTL